MDTHIYLLNFYVNLDRVSEKLSNLSWNFTSFTPRDMFAFDEIFNIYAIFFSDLIGSAIFRYRLIYPSPSSAGGGCNGDVNAPERVGEKYSRAVEVPNAGGTRTRGPRL